VTLDPRLSTALSDRYRIERELGAGGMATVYLAQDIKHDRKVALKVLKPELAAVIGAERFVVEIKTTASLQHPHILPLFDSGTAGGFLYYVMPYIEGETLRSRLDRETQLAVGEAVKLTVAVADALDYAHRHGVIHRDIKPENILLHDGRPIVADFGIALALSAAAGGRMTETGMSLGTPHYMSPEQATADKEITGRSDIYSLGSVLYEMLAGQPPHLGGSAQQIIMKIIAEPVPPVTAYRKSVPANVAAAVARSLEKVPADRFSSAAEFAAALQDPKFTLPTAGTTTPSFLGAVTQRRPAVTGAILLIGVVAGAALWQLTHPATKPTPHPIVRFGIQLPRDARSGGGTGSTIALSPDGGEIAYVGLTPNGSRLFVRAMGDSATVPIAGTEDGTLPFFSPDGKTLGFHQRGKLAQVPVTGGAVTIITAGDQVAYGASWTPDDSIIFATDSGLMIVAAQGGVQRTIARTDGGEAIRFPDVLPDGKAVLFGIVGNGTLKLGALVRRTGRIKRFEQLGGAPRYVTGGFLVLNDPSGLINAVRFDSDRLEVTGKVGTLFDRGSPTGDGDVNFGVARTGDFAFQSINTNGMRLVLVDRRGGTHRVNADSGFYYFPRFSPDGRRVLIVGSPGADPTLRDLWLLDLGQGTRTRITFDSVALFPFWAPDGRHVGYTAFRPGRSPPESPILAIPIDGSGAVESLVVRRGFWSGSASEPRGGGLLYFGAKDESGKQEIWRTAPGKDTTSSRVTSSPFQNFAPSFSPDGRWIAYISDESGRREVYVRPYPGPGGSAVVSLDGGAEPIWSPTGREIFYRSGDKMMAAAVRTQETFVAGARIQLFTIPTATPLSTTVPNYDVSRDGQSFLMLEPIIGATQDIVVTLHWFDNPPRTP
jgi:serine/threonine-protein kinase